MLAAFLLLFQIDFIAPLPVVNDGDLKEDFLYGDNNRAKKENALYRNASALHPYDSTFQRNASSSDQRNSNIVNLFLKHVRVARSSDGCARPGHFVYLCGNNQIVTYSCRTSSFACTKPPAGRCKKKTSVCGADGKIMVTACLCVG